MQNNVIIGKQILQNQYMPYDINFQTIIKWNLNIGPAASAQVYNKTHLDACHQLSDTETYIKGMRDHIIGEDYKLWDIVTDDPLATLKINAEGVEVPKTRAECTTEDLKKWEKNAKAKKWLVYGLGPDEYRRIQSYTTTKQIWDTLHVAHEGTHQVKRSKGTVLYSQYEKFTMKEGETIQEMYTRFTTLKNELKSLGRIIPKEYRVKKILTRQQRINQGYGHCLGKSSDESSNDDEEEDEQALMAIGESDEETEVHALDSTILELRSENLKLKLGTGKKIVDHTQLNLKEIVGKMKDELYKRDEQNKFLSLEDLKEGNVSFGNGKKGEIIGVGKVGKTDSHSIKNVYLIDYLNYSLISISQLCDRGNMVAFTSTKYFVINITTDNIVLQDLVIGLPNNKFKEDKVCKACARGKQVRSSFKRKKVVSTARTMELVHMDLCGSMRTLSRDDEAFDMFTSFVRKTQKQLGNQLTSIRSKHGTEFENAKFAEICDENGIDHNFSAPKTPQQNGVVERKNKTLENMARTMLLSNKFPHNFWAEAEHDDEETGLGNLTGGTEQRGSDPQTSRVPSYEPVPQQQNNEGTSKGNQLDADWVNVMQDGLNQFERSQVWHLVPRPKDRSVIGTKWVFRNKLDENGTVVMNKARLVVQGYSHEEVIDYDETFAPVVRLEEIRLLIAFAAYMEFTLHQGMLQERGMKDYHNFCLSMATREWMIHQQKYVKELLKRFKMEDFKEIGSPIATTTKLDIDEPGSSVDQKLYKGMIGSFLYLTASRPDIIFSVGLCARFQVFLWIEKVPQTYIRDFSVKSLVHQDYLQVGKKNPRKSDESFKSAIEGEETVSSEIERITSGPKITSEIIFEVAANLENRFVLVGTVAGVKTTESGKIGGKNKRRKKMKVRMLKAM
ncbi:uncharacterized protein [Nicotiana tomentosiformis]|uniref:uncharacterized protein n=1 Tax=Nicotiana tomentosiformis TaxID=4098 RepID=UPI00388C6ED2